MFVVFDAEFDSLNPTRVWCIVAREVANPEVYHVFERPDENPKEFLKFCNRVSCWIGHNVIDFDLVHLDRLVAGFRYSKDRVIDTLVVSRLLNYGIEGKHSIEAWGGRLKEEKIGLDISDWTCYTEDILRRCIQDTKVNLKLYNYFSKYITNPIFKDSLRIEHKSAFLCRKLKDTGFAFNHTEALELKKELETRLEEIDNLLVSSFPSSVEVIKEFTPKITKSGSIALKDFRWIPGEVKDLSWVKPDTEYSLVSIVPYNPGSLHETIDRLWDAGWKPSEKTKGHTEAIKNKTDSVRMVRFKQYGWKLTEENLRTLPPDAPQGAQRLVERLLIASRLSDIEEYLSAVTEAPNGVYEVHGNYNHIGSWTHRKSHNNPNMANIPVAKHSDKETELDKLINSINTRMRGLFIARPGKRLVGVDADGIQMRIFAHYVNEKVLIDALVSGSKANATDIHSVHQRALGSSCLSRDDAKTFIYAWLLGAGTAKVAEILGCSISEAKIAVESFIGFYPGLKLLKQSRIPRDAKRGYFEGLDKRLVMCDNEHKMLAGYLQNGESVIMKHACSDPEYGWYDRLVRERLPFKFVNDVHDEWQIETEDDNDLAGYIGSILASSIVNAGNHLNLNCPLAATISQRKDGFIGGYNWSETH